VLVSVLVMVGAGCWVLGAGCWVLGAGCWVLVSVLVMVGAGCWVLVSVLVMVGAGAGCWMLVLVFSGKRFSFLFSFSLLMYFVLSSSPSLLLFLVSAPLLFHSLSNQF
jgi:hypothetical protein